jgi:hypothetical protein
MPRYVGSAKMIGMVGGQRDGRRGSAEPYAHRGLALGVGYRLVLLVNALSWKLMARLEMARSLLRQCLIFLMGSLAMLLVLAVPVILRLREQAREMTCQDRLSQLVVALRNYDAEHRVFPDLYLVDKNGKPTHSWRALLLPFLDETEFYANYDFAEPWNGDHNSTLARVSGAQPRKRYQCPGDQSASSDWTSIVAIDYGTAEARGVQRLELSHDYSRRPFVVLVEIQESGVPWLEPRDLGVDEFKTLLHDPKPTRLLRSFAFSDGSIGQFVDGGILVRGSREACIPYLLTGRSAH